MLNNKGLSAVVTTLIIILLVLVAFGIVWVIVMNIVEDTGDEIQNESSQFTTPCADLGGEICSGATPYCNEPEIASKDGACCLGSCQATAP